MAYNLRGAKAKTKCFSCDMDNAQHSAKIIARNTKMNKYENRYVVHSYTDKHKYFRESHRAYLSCRQQIRLNIRLTSNKTSLCDKRSVSASEFMCYTMCSEITNSLYRYWKNCVLNKTKRCSY